MCGVATFDTGLSVGGENPASMSPICFSLGGSALNKMYIIVCDSRDVCGDKARSMWSFWRGVGEYGGGGEHARAISVPERVSCCKSKGIVLPLLRIFKTPLYFDKSRNKLVNRHCNVRQEVFFVFEKCTEKIKR